MITLIRAVLLHRHLARAVPPAVENTDHGPLIMENKDRNGPFVFIVVVFYYVYLSTTRNNILDDEGETFESIAGQSSYQNAALLHQQILNTHTSPGQIMAWLLSHLCSKLTEKTKYRD